MSVTVDSADEVNGKIVCRICSEPTHLMAHHLKQRHPEMTEAAYQAQFPGAPMISTIAARRLDEERVKKSGLVATAVSVGLTSGVEDDPMAQVITPGAMHEVFRLGSTPAALSKAGKPMMIGTARVGRGLAHFVPEIDESYVFNIDLLKTVLAATEMGINILLWGHAGTGKSTVFEQVAAYTGRPQIRIQHTRNTEESHIVGEKTVENGTVRFVLGPLPFAMKHGLQYVADEYDFAMPSVLSVYQAVMEGKPLVIKEADEENRIIRPHPNFRFLATGNTNGTGDETGLYQGTLLQNAANYERFGIVEEVKYMDPKIEAQIVASKARIPLENAAKLVDFGNKAREAYIAQKLGLPPSPRALIAAGRNGRIFGDWERGVRLAYINRLSRIDQEAANEVLKRIKL